MSLVELLRKTLALFSLVVLLKVKTDLKIRKLLVGESPMRVSHHYRIYIVSFIPSLVGIAFSTSENKDHWISVALKVEEIRPKRPNWTTSHQTDEGCCAADSEKLHQFSSIEAGNFEVLQPSNILAFFQDSNFTENVAQKSWCNDSCINDLLLHEQEEWDNFLKKTAEKPF